MTALLAAVVSWPTLILALVAFGFAPGAALRLIVHAYPNDDPRRQELLAELYAVPRWERPFWVAQQLEVAVFEGLWERVVWAATGRVIHRWRLQSGVEQNNRYPETFWIPSTEEKEAIQPGSIVKLFFTMNDGWAERMWVKVEEIKPTHLVGTLDNEPVGIPRLHAGRKVRFRREHVINILDDDNALTDCTPAVSDFDPR